VVAADVAVHVEVRYNRSMASSQGFHELESALQASTKDRHRAIVSLQEELEAIDWYDQRIDAAEDGELAQLLAHNRDEEKEHAAMLLEWLRRRDPALDAMLRRYLFAEGSILAVEAGKGAGDADDPPAAGGRSPQVTSDGLEIGGRMGGTNL